MKFKSIIFAGIGYKANTPSFEQTFVLDLINYADSIGLKVFYFDEYIVPQQQLEYNTSS